MRNPNKRASIRLGALTISLGFHAILLSVFVFVRLHSALSHTQADRGSVVSLEQVSRAIRAETTAPKPKLRSIVSEQPSIELLAVSKPPPRVDIPLRDSGTACAVAMRPRAVRCTKPSWMR